MQIKLKREQIEDAYSIVTSEGWKVIIEHIQSVIHAYQDTLVESSAIEDEKLKGYIQGLKREVLTLEDMFRKMRQEVMDSEVVKKQ